MCLGEDKVALLPLLELPALLIDPSLFQYVYYAHNWNVLAPNVAIVIIIFWAC
jgi:hypothetical protein